ncbi:MAG TPA: cupin domain-containing protein [Thermodesulfobacteriota bacterium]|nr:cupin domain-containing protein [Thermodesulfobacteriota bacterium]
MIVDNLGFGKKVRALRTQRNLTLHDLAKVTKRSVSLLSQIETGKVSPSFSTMRIIADALDLSLSQLILDEEPNEARDSSLMEIRERKVLTTQGGVQHQLLSRNLTLPFEFISFEIPPGASTGEDLYTHDGCECGLLLEGALEIQMGDKVYRMKPGDTITLNSSIPHKLLNCGKKKARAVWVNSIPMIFSTR